MSAPRVPGRSQRGLTLIELMVAIVIGLLLVLGVIRIYLATQSAVRITQAQAAIQENARAGLEFLHKEVRLAGFSSVCLTQEAERRNATSQVTGLPSNSVFNVDPGIQGYAFKLSTGSIPDVSGPPVTASANDFSPPLATELLSSGTNVPAPIKNSDVLVIRYTEAIGGVQMLSTNTIKPSILGLAPGSGVRIAPNSLLRVERCIDLTANDIFINQTPTSAKEAESLQISKPFGTKWWSSEYVKDGHLYYYHIKAFYVGVDPDSGLPGLYRYTFGLNGTGARELLIPGVSSMRVRYHMGAGDRYITADAATPLTWFGVDGVEIGVLLQNTERSGGTTSNRFELLPDASVEVNRSPYLFKSIRTSIALRNRLITKP